MLASNCAGIAERIALTVEDRMVSWLPLHHDMGLSAVTLSWWGGIDLVLMPTELYVRQPVSWLSAISKFRGTLSPAPASAYALLARYASSAARLQLDLSTWRYAWAGAEPVFDSHLRQFAESMRPLGLRSHVVVPAYGMAEAVVAVSLNPPGQPYAVVWVVSHALHRTGMAVLVDEGAPGAAAFVSNGRPIAGLEVAVLDSDGRAQVDLRTGNLCVRGESIIARYLNRGDACNSQGWYDTGDIGFTLHGEVYVCGRAKDLITRAGLNISPQEIEDAIESLLSLRGGTVGAFSYLDAQSAQEKVVVVVGRTPSAQEKPELHRAIASAVAARVRIQVDDIVFVKKSSLPKTTSGKLQRSALRTSYLQGAFLTDEARTPDPHEASPSMALNP